MPTDLTTAWYYRLLPSQIRLWLDYRNAVRSAREKLAQAPRREKPGVLTVNDVREMARNSPYYTSPYRSSDT